jgi:hypothetical protein
MIPLKVFGADRKLVVLILIFGSATISGIAAMLSRQLARLIDLIEAKERAPRQVRMPAEQNYPQVAAPPRSVSSVTEHTTRNFDHSAYNAHRTRE